MEELYLILSCRNDFSSINKFDHLLSETIFEFSVYSNVLNIFIICLYRLPQANAKLFTCKLLELLCINCQTILYGDFNIDYASMCTTLDAAIYLSH